MRSHAGKARNSTTTAISQGTQGALDIPICSIRLPGTEGASTRRNPRKANPQRQCIGSSSTPHTSSPRPSSSMPLHCRTPLVSSLHLSFPTSSSHSSPSNPSTIPASSTPPGCPLSMDLRSEGSLHSVASSQSTRSPTPDTKKRPSHPYSALIKHALIESPDERMSFQDICRSIERRFEYYRNSPTNAWKVCAMSDPLLGHLLMRWKASLRNHLSRSCEFKNVDRPGGENGRGRLWEVDRTFKIGVLNKRYCRRKEGLRRYRSGAAGDCS